VQKVSSCLTLLLWIAPLLFLWQKLIRDLSFDWSINPQYSFGWAVPVLCVYLACQGLNGIRMQTAQPSQVLRTPQVKAVSLGIVLAAVYAPIRLIQEANPDWRLVTWSLAIETIGLTLVTLWLLLPFSPRSSTKLASLFRASFPFLFFLVAVPWPTLVEKVLTNGLTAAVALGTTELLSLLGVPSVLHGSVVEVSSGAVGIIEDCSGMRSFQASLMLTLFFGETFDLNLPRRLLLTFGGLGFSVLLNLVRVTLLAFVVAQRGLSALSPWHDAVSITIPAASFLGIWLLSMLLRTGACATPATMGSGHLEGMAWWCRTASRPIVVPLVFALWVAVVEAGTESWYHLHERSLPAATTWHVEVPRDRGDFRELSFPPGTRRLLRFDEGINGAWLSDDGLKCQVIFLRWNPGRVAMKLARNHTPADCLLAAGAELVAASDQLTVSVHGLEIPFRGYVARDSRGPMHVFYCLWEDRAARRTFSAEWLSYSSRLEAVLAGQRNCGQRSLEVAFRGAENDLVAQAALQSVVDQIILTAD
jgi:exosortase